MSTGLSGFLGEERGRVEAALERALETLLPRLPGELRGPVRHGVLAGGKRLRPVLCVAAYRASGGPHPLSDALYDLAASLELIHAYSLMHDDLPCMDDAQLRRGRPTPHTLFGERATVVGGAVLIAAAGLQAWRSARALALEDEECRELVRTLAGAAGGGGMVGGQGLDLLAEGRRLGRRELDELHGLKTGALLTASLRMGALAARAESGKREALEGYGRAIGLAFQVTDDVLDATATVEALGKHPSDAELDKSTYARLLGVEGARAVAVGEVERALGLLDAQGIRAPELEGLARYIITRDR